MLPGPAVPVVLCFAALHAVYGSVDSAVAMLCTAAAVASLGMLVGTRVTWVLVAPSFACLTVGLFTQLAGTVIY